MDTNKKQYGLLIPKKNTSISASTVKKPSVFEDSDSDQESSVDWVKKTLQKGTYGSGQSRANIDRALQEDPTVFQYDEVYDDLEKKKQEATVAKQSDKKPKYMQRLFAAADRRKIEDERRKERQIQKEREAEGDEFKDKECFVTSAYKKKLEELKKLEDAEKKNDILEEIGDVTKQPDLSGFYRHLYENISPKREKSEEKDSIQEVNNVNTNRKSKPVRQYRKHVSTSESSSEDETLSNKEKSKLETEDLENTKKRELPSSEDTEENTKKLKSVNSTSNNTKPLESVDADSSSASDDDDHEKSSKTNVNEEKKNENESKTCDDDVLNNQEIAEKPRRSIWEKRTVGEVFEAALQRYYERKASKLSIEVS